MRWPNLWITVEIQSELCSPHQLTPLEPKVTLAVAQKITFFAVGVVQLEQPSSIHSYIDSRCKHAAGGCPAHFFSHKFSCIRKGYGRVQVSILSNIDAAIRRCANFERVFANLCIPIYYNGTLASYNLSRDFRF